MAEVANPTPSSSGEGAGAAGGSPARLMTLSASGPPTLGAPSHVDVAAAAAQAGPSSGGSSAAAGDASSGQAAPAARRERRDDDPEDWVTKPLRWMAQCEPDSLHPHASAWVQLVRRCGKAQRVRSRPHSHSLNPCCIFAWPLRPRLTCAVRGLPLQRSPNNLTAYAGSKSISLQLAVLDHQLPPPPPLQPPPPEAVLPPTDDGGAARKRKAAEAGLDAGASGGAEGALEGVEGEDNVARILRLAAKPAGLRIAEAVWVGTVIEQGLHVLENAGAKAAFSAIRRTLCAGHGLSASSFLAPSAGEEAAKSVESFARKLRIASGAESQAEVGRTKTAKQKPRGKDTGPAVAAAAGVPGATGESLIDGDTGQLALPMPKAGRDGNGVGSPTQ